jgi:hypothetical protein
LQTVSRNSQGQEKPRLTDTQNNSLQTSLQKNPEKEQKSVVSLPADLAEIVRAWPRLSEAIRSAIIAIVRTSDKKQGG